MDDDRRAALDGVQGRGYAVVESLGSLGKGRRCTGIFTADATDAGRLEAAREARRRVRFEGLVHSRHVSRRAELAVEVTRLGSDDGEVTVEFTAWGVPYDLGSV